MKKIYLVLSYTGTILSRIVRAYTKKTYAHISISLDEDLQQMYSFGRINPYVAFIGGLIYINIVKEKNKEIDVSAQTATIFESISSNTTGTVTKYIVYGTHFNLEGQAEISKISGISISNVSVIIKDIEDEIALKSTYTYKDNTLSFSTIDKINEGLDLESLSSKNHYIFLKVIFSNGDTKYYSLSNDTEYENITYYTITKNNSNNKIDIKFDTYNDTPFMGLFVSKVDSLPDDVYDIVIDPGHGGRDVGATSGKYNEADIVLSCGLTLKQKLENLGYKVLLTRDGSESDDENTAYNMYDDEGRVTISNESHAKLLISLHLNSNSAKLSKGGVEVYAPCNCSLDFASLLADNIVKTANTSYSSLTTYKEADGVYVRNFTQYDIASYKTKAEKGGYEPYNLTTSTPYLYMIREIGGIATNAFVDGRNTSYSANKYYNSNVGIEGYLVELGYMIINKDLNNIIKNKDLYMQAIAESINESYPAYN